MCLDPRSVCNVSMVDDQDVEGLQRACEDAPDHPALRPPVTVGELYPRVTLCRGQTEGDTVTTTRVHSWACLRHVPCPSFSHVMAFHDAETSSADRPLTRQEMLRAGDVDLIWVLHDLFSVSMAFSHLLKILLFSVVHMTINLVVDSLQVFKLTLSLQLLNAVPSSSTGSLHLHTVHSD